MGRVLFGNTRWEMGEGARDINGRTSELIFLAEGSDEFVSVELAQVKDLRITYKKKYQPFLTGNDGVTYITRIATLTLRDGKTYRGLIPTQHTVDATTTTSRYVVVETAPLVWKKFELPNFFSSSVPEIPISETVVRIEVLPPSTR